MADTKNYGLKGVGDDVQFGKGGGRFVFNTGASDFRATTDGTTLAHLQVLDPVSDTDAATKLYVDSTAQGLDSKESVVCATTATTGTYNSTGGPLSNGQLTSVAASIDGVTLAEGDRVLIKNHSTAAANGIYVVTATTTTLNRAPDFDEDDEVTAGAYCFVEEGTTNINTGWVLQGPDPLTVGGAGGSDLNWVLFSVSGTVVAGDGINKTGDTLNLDFTDGTFTNTVATVGADQIAFADTSNSDAMQLRTWTNVLADLDIVTATADGIIVRTAADTYASRTITASAVAGDEGISVVNGDGVSGNPTIGIDIVGQTNLTTDDIDDADELLIYHSIAGGTEGIGNYAVTASKLKTYMNAGTSSTSISEGDSSVAVADAGAGTVTTTVDGTVQVVTNATTTTFQNGNDVVLNSTSTLTIADLTDNDVLIAGTGGLVEDSGGNLTFDGTTLTVTGALQVDNINANLNTISITDTDGNLILQPNGTGQITLANGSGEEVLEIQDTVAAVNGLAITAGATGNPAQITTGTGSEANIDIGFLTNGTGVISVVAGTGNYEDNVTADDDIPNKKYVDDAIAAGAVSGGLDSVTGTVDLTSATAQNIGSATGIPANATIMSVTLDITTASDAATTVTVGDATNGAASYMAATENDPETLGIYIADGRLANGAGDRQAQATVATAGTVGAATCIITFRHA